MKKISKVIAIIMSLVLVFSLAACGTNSNKGNSNLKVGKYDKKPKNDDINNIFASRGYR
jgi:uncharacterized lipoprotein YehR (DUF1307 family)